MHPWLVCSVWQLLVPVQSLPLWESKSVKGVKENFMLCAAVGDLWVDVDKVANGLYCMMLNGINLNENTVFLKLL